MRTVVLTAMCSDWPEAEKAEGLELWGVNRSFTVEPRLDRLYSFDPEHLFKDGYVQELSDLGIPIYTREEHPEIPNSVRFPREDIARFFKGLKYSTCTVAYMIQHAIYEHHYVETIDKLVLNGMYHQRDSLEYLWSLPCLHFWLGMASGCGMDVSFNGDTALVRAMPWESNEYGYRRNTNADLCIATMAAAYKACYEYPRTFVTADDEQCPTEDLDSLLKTRKQFETMLGQVNERIEEIAPAEAVV